MEDDVISLVSHGLFILAILSCQCKNILSVLLPDQCFNYKTRYSFFYFSVKVFNTVDRYGFLSRIALQSSRCFDTDHQCNRQEMSERRNHMELTKRKQVKVARDSCDVTHSLKQASIHTSHVHASKSCTKYSLHLVQSTSTHYCFTVVPNCAITCHLYKFSAVTC